MSALPNARADCASLLKEPDSERLAEVGVEELIVGQTLTRPIYDVDGTLLLSEQLQITAEFKRLLRKRRIRRIQLHPRDLSQATRRGAESSREASERLDRALTARLDEIIDSGLLFVINQEPAVFERMRPLGCKGYDQVKHNELVERNRETSAHVDKAMQAALHGEACDAGGITQVTVQYLDDMVDDVDSVLASLVTYVQQKSIASHCVDVALVSMGIGVEMGLDATNVRHLGMAALVHDWGMSYVTAETLQADKWLTEEEFCEITRHPICGVRLLEKISGIPSVVPIVAYQVHERPNGEGYPKGRTGERIHPMAKIVAVADTFTALTSPRPFRPPLMRYAAMECLLRQAATGDCDAEAVRALLMVQSLFPIGSYVMLTDGCVARVLRRNGDKYMRPIVQLVQDHNGADVPLTSDRAIVDLDQAGLDIARALATPGKEEITLSPEIMERPYRGFEAPSRTEQSPADSVRNLFAHRHSALRSPTPPACVSLECYTERQKRQAEWVLDFLWKASKLEDKWHQEVRRHERTAVRGIVHVRVPDPNRAILDFRSPDAFRALIRDVASGGLSFIHPALLNADHLIVGIEVPEEEIRWFHAEVVRTREIAETEFWEYGVAFRRKLLV